VTWPPTADGGDAPRAAAANPIGELAHRNLTHSVQDGREPRGDPTYSVVKLNFHVFCLTPPHLVLQEDPEFADFFGAVQSGGMAALQQYMGNPDFLAKLGERIGDIDLALPGEKRPAAPPGAAAAAPPGAQAPPEIENLLQAAK
jgi:hypothetical protein